MKDYQEFKHTMESAVEGAVRESVGELLDALMGNEDYDNAIDAMEDRDAARCRLAFDLIMLYETTLIKHMQDEVNDIMEMMAGMSIWPATKREVIFAAHDEVMAIQAVIAAEKAAKQAAEKEAGFRKHLPK